MCEEILQPVVFLLRFLENKIKTHGSILLSIYTVALALARIQYIPVVLYKYTLHHMESPGV